jgi:hypothetical protein
MALSLLLERCTEKVRTSDGKRTVLCFTFACSVPGYLPAGAQASLVSSSRCTVQQLATLTRRYRCVGSSSQSSAGRTTHLLRSVSGKLSPKRRSSLNRIAGDFAVRIRRGACVRQLCPECTQGHSSPQALYSNIFHSVFVTLLHPRFSSPKPPAATTDTSIMNGPLSTPQNISQSRGHLPPALSRYLQ